MNDHTPPLELWIQDVQSYLYKVLRVSMEPAGFKFDKDNYSFHRKFGKNIQEFGFFFINQFPLNYRVSFVLQIRNKTVREMKSSFFDHIQKTNFRLSSMVIFLYDFMREMPYMEPVRDFILYTNNDLFQAGDSIARILRERALPLCDELTSIADIDNYFSHHPCWSVNTLNLDNIVSELIVARLNAKREYEELYLQLASALDKKIDDKLIDPSSREVIQSCYSYFKRKILA